MTDDNTIDLNPLATEAINTIKESFMNYTLQFDKDYPDKEEYEKRLSIYTANVLEVQKHNLGNHTWTKSVNKFSDLSGQEFEEHQSNC